MKERKIAELRTSEYTIIKASGSVAETVASYRGVVRKDMGEVAPGVYAAESLVMPGPPAIKQKGSLRVQVARDIERGEDVLGKLAESNLIRPWQVSGPSGIVTVHSSVGPWLWIECSSYGEAVRCASTAVRLPFDTYKACTTKSSSR